jgi:hypothetical protein
MLRSSHLLLRWLRLAMACIALAIGATPAPAQSLPDAPAAVRVVGRSTAPQASVRATPRQEAPTRTDAPTGPSRHVAPSRVPRPSGRFFILHRALLR